jgi:itaconyl-CoA hydratase
MPLANYRSPTRYEDFVVGAVLLHEQRRVVTETDNLLFSRLSAHEHPCLFPYARRRDGPVAVLPFLVLAICGGVAVRATSQAAIANLGWEYVRFPNPAYVGDLLGAVSRIEDKRLSRHDPAKGVVTIVTYGVRQDDTIVLEAKRSFLVRAGSGGGRAEGGAA